MNYIEKNILDFLVNFFQMELNSKDVLNQYFRSWCRSSNVHKSGFVVVSLLWWAFSFCSSFKQSANLSVRIFDVQLIKKSIIIMSKLLFNFIRWSKIWALMSHNSSRRSQVSFYIWYIYINRVYIILVFIWYCTEEKSL